MSAGRRNPVGFHIFTSARATMAIHRSMSRAALVLGASLSAAAFSASATPFFATQTGKDCVACHHAGRESDGKASLNPMGQAFLQCGFKFDCSNGPVAPPWSPPAPPRPTPTPPGPAPTPAPRPAPNSPSIPSPIGPLRADTFRDTCKDDDSYFVVYTGLSHPSRLSFVLKNHHKVTLFLPAGASFSAACGHTPDGPRKPVTFD